MSNCCDDSIPYTRATLAPAVAAATTTATNPVVPPTIVEGSSFKWTSLANDAASGNGSIWRESSSSLSAWTSASTGLSVTSFPVDKDSGFEFKVNLPATDETRVGLVHTNATAAESMSPFFLEFSAGNVYVDGGGSVATTVTSGDWFRFLHNYTDQTVAYQKKDAQGVYQTFATSTSFTRGQVLYADFATQGAQNGIVGAKYIYGGSFEFSSGTSTSAGSGSSTGTTGAGVVNATNYSTLQAAVDALTADTPVLEIPAGTYSITSDANTGSGLIINKTFAVTLVGQGEGTILKHVNTIGVSDGTGEAMIKAGSSSHTIELRDLVLDGDTATNSASNVNDGGNSYRKALINTTGGNRKLICRNVVFQDFFIGVEGLGSVTIDGCTFKDIADNGGTGSDYYPYTAAMRLFPDNNFQRLTVVDSDFSVTADLSIPTATQLRTGRSPFGIIVSPNGAAEYSQVTISRNRFYGFIHPIDTYNGVKETAITDNHVKGFSYAGLKVQRSEGVIISGNTIEEGYAPTDSGGGGNFCAGIAVNADARLASFPGTEGDNVGVTIANNVIKNVEKYGILCQQTYGTVANNVIDTINLHSSSTITIGIQIDPSSSTTTDQNTVVVGNVVKGCTTPFFNPSGPDVVQAGNTFDTILGYGPGAASSVYVTHSANIHTTGFSLTLPVDKNWVSLLQTDAGLWQTNSITNETDPVPLKTISGGSVGQRIILQKGNDTASVGGQTLDTPPITLMAGGNIVLHNGLTNVRLTNSRDTVELVKGSTYWYLVSNATQTNWVDVDIAGSSTSIDLSTQTLSDLEQLDNVGLVFVSPSAVSATDTITTLPDTYPNGARLTIRKSGGTGTITFSEPSSPAITIAAGDPNIFFPSDGIGRASIPKLFQNTQTATFQYYAPTNRWNLESVNFEDGIEVADVDLGVDGAANLLQVSSGHQWVQLIPENGSVTTHSLHSLGAMRLNGREVTLQGTTGLAVTLNDASVNSTTGDGKLYLPTTNLVLDDSKKLATFIYNLNDGAWYLKSKNF